MRDMQTCPLVKLTESIEISKKKKFDFFIDFNSPVRVTHERTYRKNDAKTNAL